MTDRDYATEMRALIDEATSHGPYSAPIIATEVVEKLRANDTDLLAGWLDLQAEDMVRHVILKRDHSRRTVTSRRAKAVEFSDAADAAEGGDVVLLRRFMDSPYTVESGLRKPLAALTRDDLLYVATTYEKRAADNAMRASFMQALAKKVKTGTVADHFTEEQIAGMFDSLAA